MKFNPHHILAFLNLKIKAIKIGLILGLISVLLSACEHSDPSVSIFKSDFTGIAERTWIGPEYWANPMQDWQVSNGRIEYLVSNENRNIHLLTQQLERQEGTLKMKVSLGFFNRSIIKNNKNWAGFSIGSKGEPNAYGDDVIFDKGINVGVCTNGALFIGEPSLNQKKSKIIDKLSNGIDLILSASPKGRTYTLNVSIQDSETGTMLSNISKNGISPDQLVGDVVLVSNFENIEKDKTNATKSTWFKDWELSGSKVITIADDKTKKRSQKEMIQKNTKNKEKVTVADFTENND